MGKYSEKDYKKYTTAEERKLLQRAEQKIISNLRRTIIPTALYGPVALPGSAVAAAATPTWDPRDVKEFVENDGYKYKLMIPGYDPYTRLKVAGFARSLRNKVLEGLEEDKNKQSEVVEKQASMSKRGSSSNVRVRLALNAVNAKIKR